MGSILQERSAERGSITDRGWRRKASRSSSRTAGTNMGRRQQQRRSPQPQSPNQREENQEQTVARRKRRSRSNPSSSSGAELRRSGRPDCGGQKVKPSSAERGVHRNCTPPGRAPPPCSPNQTDSDTDLSESERPHPSPCRCPPPQLQLRPEVMEEDQPALQRQRVRGRRRGGPDFPDFLPPPFNSWSLGQLAVFYNMEGRGALGPRPVGPLERYLERLLHLEWYQIQTVQAEREVGGVTAACQRAGAPSRLSSPKCILHCPRALPFLCGSVCALCPAPDRSRGLAPLPKRSYSESRVRSGSPSRTSSYLRRMQASGNMRHPMGMAARAGSDPTAGGPRQKTDGGETEQSRTKAERTGSQTGHRRCHHR
ncbi:PREDICTED: protein FAM217B-like [Cyprinodon variegatus]|uniref:protein FAM217B-like n=1 Tax=Cyprinodon variegatus TaxID=28743 RepID=UPI00074262DC|nr:PREDICTED: protein FAM217B-like [Cyprinodon variegatus]